MKKILLLSAMGALASVGTLAGAEEVGRVISSTPVIQQVAVPRQVCNNQPMVVQQPSSGGGAVVGGLTGGLIGNTVAHGDARGIATILGVVGGAMVGDSVERANKTAVQNVPQCTTQTFYENRTVGYNVVYEYAGKQFTVQMPYDPGPTIRLQVSPVAANAPDMRAAPAANANGRGVIVAPPVNGQAYGDQTTAQGGYPAAQGSGQPIGQVIGSPGQSGVVVNETGTPGGYSAEYYPYPTPTYHPYSYPYGYNAYGYYPYGYSRTVTTPMATTRTTAGTTPIGRWAWQSVSASATAGAAVTATVTAAGATVAAAMPAGVAVATVAVATVAGAEAVDEAVAVVAAVDA